MKKSLLSALSLAMLLTTTGVWAETGKCPPDKKAVESFCQQKSPGKADQCGKDIIASCKKDLQAAASAQAAEKARAEIVADGDKSLGWYTLHLCMYHYGGSLIGCVYWLAR